MLGKKISPILSEIENILWEFEFENDDSKPNYTTEGFRSTIKIFSSVMMDKMWNLQSAENMDMDDRCNMVTKFGEDLRKLVKTYVDIDTQELYK